MHRGICLLCATATVAMSACNGSDSRMPTCRGFEDAPFVAEIRALLEQQAAAWNRGDIDGFMDAYERADTLTFSAGGKTTRGWTATRDRYRAKYDTPRKMGRLTFGNLEFRFPGERTALVLGRWKLDLVDNPPAGGNFSLVLTRGSDGNWRIVHDHTSSDPPVP